MSSTWIADIPIPNITNVDKIEPSITKVEHLSSYNWIESSTPTIAVPGCPPLWSPPKIAQKVAKDSGLIYIAQNAYRHPESPLEPLFRSLYIEKPSYNIRQVDLITDRNNIRKLLSFINPDLATHGVEPFTIEIEVTGNTMIFSRAETKTHEFIKPNEFKGFGHEFEKAFTKPQGSGTTGHHRVISYRFGDLNFIVRYETDAYVKEVSNPQAHDADTVNEDLVDIMGDLSLSQRNIQLPLSTESRLVVRENGERVPISSTLEIKTRVFHKPLDLEGIIPQLWISQTPNLVRAYHKSGVFAPPKVEDVTREIAQWERSHVDDLRKLVALIKEIFKVARENDGNVVIRYDGQGDSLAIYRREGSKMLPDDLYLKFANESGSTKETESDPRRTRIKIGDTFYKVDISAIPYFSAFVRFQRHSQPENTDLIHGNIALFDVALKGLESGYRTCFRSLQGDISQYHILCDTYDFLGIDVLAGQSIDDIFSNLKACKTDYELDYKRYRAIKGDKSRARDAAFRLLSLIIRGEFGDEVKDAAKVYNSVLFVLSHSGTFKRGTRTAVRSAHEERFSITDKQQKQLDRWRERGADNASGYDLTTEDESEDYYFSDDS
jgi:hypothetical protein